MLTVKCANCSTEFNTHPSRIKSGRGKYCSRACSDKITLLKKGSSIGKNSWFKKGTKPWNSTGFRYQKSRANGKPYKEIHMPDHPLSSKSGYVREHRLVVEKHLGRYLEKFEIVHHIDGDTLNNSIENLQVMYKKDHDRMNTPLNIHRRWYRRSVM